MHTAEGAKWLSDNIAPLLVALNPAHHHVPGEGFARKGDLTLFVPLEISAMLQKREAFRVELRTPLSTERLELPMPCPGLVCGMHESPGA